MTSPLERSGVPGSLETLQGELGNVLISLEGFAPLWTKDTREPRGEGLTSASGWLCACASDPPAGQRFHPFGIQTCPCFYKAAQKWVLSAEALLRESFEDSILSASCPG